MATFAADEGSEDDEKVQGQALALKVDEIQPCLTGNADAAVEGIGLSGRDARLGSGPIDLLEAAVAA
jgi:hypothetical protein